MKATWKRREETIARAIRVAGPPVLELGPGRWEILLSNGSSFGVSAVLDADWLMLETPLSPVAATAPTACDGRTAHDGRAAWAVHDDGSRAAALLHANGSLAGLAKFADRGRGRTSIQAEIPTGGGVPLSARLVETLQGFSDAHAFTAGTPMPQAADTGESPGSSRRAVDAVRKTPWTFHERDDGSIAVELESDRGYHTARPVVRDGQAFTASVAVVEWRDPSPASRDAGARMLLAANHGIRMARATVLEEEDRWTARVEITLGSVPGESEMHHVLAALAVACRHWARELQSLQQETTARTYLAVRTVRS